MEKPTVVFMYDFDNTLIDGVSEFGIIHDILGYEEESEWWDKVNEFGMKYNMDPILATLYMFKTELEKNNIVVNKQLFASVAKSLKFFNGLDDWFERINSYANSLNLRVDHYVISSGFKDIIEASKIAPNFKKIFGSSFVYSDDGKAIWPCHAINYTNKTQYIYRIRKHLTEKLSDFGEVNEYVRDKSTLIPYERMLYFGDGMTDVPCMKILTIYNGNSICVYKKNDEKAYNQAKQLYLDKRVKSFAPADYSEDGELEHIAKHILRKIASYIE